MMKYLLVSVCVAALSVPAAAQSSTMTGKVQPDQAVRVKVNVDQSLANSAKISADSAFVLARAHANDGEVSSGELEMYKGRLVYDVKVLNPHKKASRVRVDAMTGEVVKAKTYGGLRAPLAHHKENKKLLEAKRDSMAKNP